jgi:subtilase family serine protease
LIAIADQRAGYPLGFVSNALYVIENNPYVSPASYHDITSGNNSVDGIIGDNAGPGWDATTGLGSPNGLTLDNLIVFTSPLDGLIGTEDNPFSSDTTGFAARNAHAGRSNPH